jgi:hypothetical protein
VEATLCLTYLSKRYNYSLNSDFSSLISTQISQYNTCHLDSINSCKIKLPYICERFCTYFKQFTNFILVQQISKSKPLFKRMCRHIKKIAFQLKTTKSQYIFRQISTSSFCIALGSIYMKL